MAKPKFIDMCRARGCGSYLYGVGSEVIDGEIAFCASCGRQHTFVVVGDGVDATVRVMVHRKPTPKRGGSRRG